MKAHTLGLLCLLVMLTSLPSPSKAGSFRVWRQVIGGGAINAATNSLRTRGTIGQSPTGWFATTKFQHGVGFWYTLSRRVTTAVGDPPTALGFQNRLDQNSPNPFNPRTTIRFSLSVSGPVKLDLFDLRGRRVAQLLDQEMSAGEHDLVFHPTDLASGVYVYRIQAGAFTQSRRITLIK
jgi:hypothetical protein